MRDYGSVRAMQMIRRLMLVGALAFAPLAASAAGDDMRAANLNRVEARLSSLTTIAADFTQTSSDGSTGSGKFYLKRPGKMRWQYNPPTPLLLVSNGKTVTYYDAGLQQVSYIDIDDTLAGFLTKKVIQLDNESTQLTDYAAENGVIRVTLVQRKKPSDGSLTLEFDSKTMEIKNMNSIDATGNATRVTFSNAQYGTALDDELFVFKDPRGVNAKRNKKK